MGGVQALSRSFFGRLIPADRSAEFFGFFNVFGKFAAILGPVLVGVVGEQALPVEVVVEVVVRRLAVGDFCWEEYF